LSWLDQIKKEEIKATKHPYAKLQYQELQYKSKNDGSWKDFTDRDSYVSLAIYEYEIRLKDNAQQKLCKFYSKKGEVMPLHRHQKRALDILKETKPE